WCTVLAILDLLIDLLKELQRGCGFGRVLLLLRQVEQRYGETEVVSALPAARQVNGGQNFVAAPVDRRGIRFATVEVEELISVQRQRVPLLAAPDAFLHLRPLIHAKAEARDALVVDVDLATELLGLLPIGFGMNVQGRPD